MIQLSEKCVHYLKKNTIMQREMPNATITWKAGRTHRMNELIRGFMFNENMGWKKNNQLKIQLEGVLSSRIEIPGNIAGLTSSIA
jgi:hypothetical protein